MMYHLYSLRNVRSAWLHKHSLENKQKLYKKGTWSCISASSSWAPSSRDSACGYYSRKEDQKHANFGCSRFGCSRCPSHYIVSKSVFYTPYGTQKWLRQSIQRQKVSYWLALTAAFPGLRPLGAFRARRPWRAGQSASSASDRIYSDSI